MFRIPSNLHTTAIIEFAITYIHTLLVCGKVVIDLDDLTITTANINECTSPYFRMIGNHLITIIDVHNLPIKYIKTRQVFAMVMQYFHGWLCSVCKSRHKQLSESILFQNHWKSSLHVYAVFSRNQVR